ncbi:hypothetical protein SAMN02746065_1444 [Desulfocicer vacuolatum DSM 3385]|uniref:DUF1302 domain-containing protein n=1 Tax=Desulfocicer vacuolatum DSM 3385 TaxID=1121400 RepID=A0A1W2ETC9_9BACT|nr:DUF1302 family protein [Desulfocicer vacuolatum]SMD12957.1 hypothetical protein SAMN02746065_1444 [Desulfocicer vacuolatum DSM 3385]
MTDRANFKKKKLILRGGVTLLVMLMLAFPVAAVEFDFGQAHGSIMGYINQSVGFNITGGDHFDTQQDFNSAVFQALVETKVHLTPRLRFFGSVSLNADWAYGLLDGKDDWKAKGFDKADDDRFILGDFDDVLKEFHLTWTPGDFMFRVGKQVVVWGETDGIRIMDQINPEDQRRGITDVEFESTILPLWLLRAEYFITPDTEWMTELGFQFIFNPNVKFRSNESVSVGGDVWGIWGANVMAGPGMSVGSFDQAIEEPDEWDDEGYEYGFRIRTVMADAIMTLNYFNGVANTPVTIMTGDPRIEVSPWDNRLILHLPEAGYYPDLEFVGATFTRDFPGIYIKALGGVSPVLRAEIVYAMDSTFTNNLNAFEELDELQIGIGLDWKFKINFLNPKAYFSLFSQFVNRKILDYPDYGLSVQSNRKDWIFVMNTTYFHNKLEPAVTYWHDETNNADLLKLELGWEYSHKWEYTIGAVFFSGDKDGAGFEPFANKDQFFMTVSHRF